MRVLRVVFLLLVLGNLLWFARAQGYLGPLAEEGEGERLSHQIAPEKLRLVATTLPSATSDKSAESCWAFANLDAEAAERLIASIGERAPLLRISRKPQDTPRWWVHIPAQSNLAMAERKAAELASLGVTDYYVVRDSGPHQFALSLGLYKSEQGANDYLTALQKKGVRSARIETREARSDKSRVEIRGTLDQLEPLRNDLADAFNAATPGECGGPP